MADIIINFQAPLELDDLIDRYERDGLTNIDHILNFENTLKEWTVDKNCHINDNVFFMCAKTSKDHMARVRKQAAECVDWGTLDKEVLVFANEELKLYKQYAGHIVAVGRIAADPFQDDDSGYAYPAWRTKWYAKIDDFKRLKTIISIDEYRDFITVSRTGSITILTKEQSGQLQALIQEKNQL